MKKGNYRLIIVIVIAMVIGLFFGKQFFVEPPQNNSIIATQNVSPLPNNNTDAGFFQNNKRKIRNNQIPKKAIAVLNYIKEHQKPMQGYVGGRVFSNRERRLPKADDDGKAIQYQEWDINPKVKNQNRGAERIVTGSDGSAWFTNDHYQSFIEIK